CARGGYWALYALPYW
nr:immunoglobulin heavy chain junction region [Mus musculus]MBK4196823.1 immunoglobulin heavy chain junction region [Mus musculus]MBK4196829.1 immunoglobulin heavy chain junction region [Mus musculus]